MGKEKMPTVKQFLEKTVTYDPKKDPVWVYLEKEMLANQDKKPYNAKVGRWLRFLKELRYHYYCEEKYKKRRLVKEVGPNWYVEFSTVQREVLKNLKMNMHKDLLEDVPKRIRRALSNLGITLKIRNAVLMKAMFESVEDPGVFMWKLYEAIYKVSPCELRSKYDMNAMLIMSSLVFIDLEECIETLEAMTAAPKAPPSILKKKEWRNYTPNVRYGEYLQTMHAKCYLPSSSGARRHPKPSPLGCKFKLRSESSYTKLRNDPEFLEKRKERNRKAKESERICNYKFWEPPAELRNTDPKQAAYVNKLKMIKMKAKQKYKETYKNVQIHVGGVSFTGGRPNYIITNTASIPTGYIPINGGVVPVNGEYVTSIVGYWKFPVKVKKQCSVNCNCLEKWENAAIEHVVESKCKCRHLYDYRLEGICQDKFFYPPTKHGPFWFDEAKVFQMDPTEDFVKDRVNEFLLSKDATPEPSLPALSASRLAGKKLLEALFADLSDTPLLIPHLPQSNLLHNLLEWVRKRVRGNLTDKQKKQHNLVSQRRWLDLKHLDFRARANMIPFTLKQLEAMDWSNRGMIQEMFNILLEDFVSRNRRRLFEQTRLWWPTTKYDAYPGKAFLDVFFTYMPGRMKDSFLINPYTSLLTPKYGAKTCPLKF